MRGEVLVSRSLLAGDAPDVAPRLLGTLLVSDLGGHRVAGRIVEVEAYTGDDPASHAFSGRTPRNSVMFDEAGRLYAYLSYGKHVIGNITTGEVGDGQAVLIRAMEVVDGIDTVRRRRRGRGDRELTNGPGKVGQAIGLTLAHNGSDLCDPSSPIRLVADGTPPPRTPIVGPRVGITKGVDTPWRFRVDPRA